MQPWDGIITKDEINRYESVGFGGKGDIGRRPALLIIDVQYRTVGTARKFFWDSIREFPTSCGDAGWKAIDHIAPLLAEFRNRKFPVLYPHVAPKDVSTDGGRLAAKIPAIMTVEKPGYDFVTEVAPQPGDVLIPKKHPSAFFGTPLVSHLIDLCVDTLFITGCTTSGCVRASVIDAFSYNFNVILPQECCYDRTSTSHAVNLWDMNAKYADVMSTADAMELLKKVGTDSKTG
jgi:maleamate amidohydrolase